MFDQRQLRMDSVFYSWILAEGVILSSPDARQKAWASEPWNVTGGKSSTDLGLTLSLPDWTWKLLKNLTLLSQSCQHVYCMTILQEEFWCFVNFELFEHCVCVTEQCPQSSSYPSPSPTSWAKSRHKVQFPRHLQHVTANSRCPLKPVK